MMLPLTVAMNVANGCVRKGDPLVGDGPCSGGCCYPGYYSPVAWGYPRYSPGVAGGFLV